MSAIASLLSDSLSSVSSLPSIPGPPKAGHSSSIGAHSVASVTSHMVVMPQTCAAPTPPVVRQHSQHNTAAHHTA